jgi:hypothetical protein
MKKLLIILSTLTSLVISADDAVSSKDVEIIAPKDKSPYVRSFPGIVGYNSGIYGIPGHPYPFVSVPLEIGQAVRWRLLR